MKIIDLVSRDGRLSHTKIWANIGYAAAQGELPDPAGVADAPAASVEDAATTVVENYSTYHEVAEQLRALQQWVNQQQEHAQ